MRPIAKRTAGAILLVLALAALAGPGSAHGASGHYWQECDPVASYQVSILAHRVDCDRAKRTIAKVYRKGQEPQGDPGLLHVNGFLCRLSPAYGTRRSPVRPVTCQRDSSWIKAAMP